MNKEEEKIVDDAIMETLLQLQEIGMVAAPEKSSPILRKFALKVLLESMLLDMQVSSGGVGG